MESHWKACESKWKANGYLVKTLHKKNVILTRGGSPHRSQPFPP
ncbi:hypothetical protein [Vibrio phage vB_VpaP_M9]|nr:hypothetical protein [Vibrio phage vB_VpaP_M9]